MSITILSRPYDGLGTLPKLNPVYNGLGFAVTSNMNKLPNFKYIAEIFINGGKIGQLSHNPDISNNNIGIFDIGRIVENYISYNLNWNVTTPTLAPNSAVGYHVEFGEEYSRVVNIKVISDYGGRIRIVTSTPHHLFVGDRILIQGCTVAATNGYKTIRSLQGLDTIILEEPYTSSTIGGAFFLSGEKANMFQSYIGANGQSYVRMRMRGVTSFSTGNIININIDPTPPSMPNDDKNAWIYGYQNMDWSVVKVVPSTGFSYVDTNIPFQKPISNLYTASVVSRSNFLLRNVLSTKNDNSMAFNGVEQYDTWADWTPYPYIMTRGANTSADLGKFLTKRPRKAMKVCYSDYFLLSQFGKTNWTGSIVPKNTQYIIETWSTPPAAKSVTAITAGSGGQMTIRIAGNVLEDYSPGSYIRVNGWYLISGVYIQIHTDCRIAYQITNGSDTVLYLCNADGTGTIPWYNSANILVFSGYSALMQINLAHPWTVASTKKVKYNIFSPTSGRNEAPAGPKNLNLTEINNKTCYKYFAYHVDASISGTKWYSYEKYSETFEFDIDCKCSKFKKHTLIWLNDLGGWDFYYFNLKSDIVREIDRVQFGRHLKSYQGNSVGFKYAQGDRGRTTYDTRSLDSTTVRSEYLSQEELKWMANLLESPEVYWIDNTTNSIGQAVDKIIPVNIKESSFDLWNKNNRNDGTGTLYIYELTIQPANDRAVQRGGKMNAPVSATGNIPNPDSPSPVVPSPPIVGPVGPKVLPNGPWSTSYASYKTFRDQYQSATGTYTKSFYE